MPPIAAPHADGSVRIATGSRAYVTTKPLSLEDSSPVIRAPARVAFRDGAVSQVGMPVAGRVTAILVKTGDHVKQGDPLVTLLSPDAAVTRSAVATAAAEHDVALKEDAMAKTGVGIETERAAAQARLRQSEVELSRTQTTAGLLGGGGGPSVTLRAPVDGTVIARHAVVGAVVQPGGDPLIELGNPNALWVIADVFERDLPQVVEGAAVDIELSSHSGAPVKGTVTMIGSALTGSLRTAPVYITLDAPPTDLRAGMFARAAVKMVAGKSLVLPSEAVLIKNGKTYVVYVRTGEDTFAPHEVKIGPSVDGRVQVLSGVAVGDQVVIKGALLLDGAAEQLL
jgi:cobalt-zinc-cadmium efflux system membrane fusion protein